MSITGMGLEKTLLKEVVSPNYLQALAKVRAVRFEELGETVIGDLILPLPFSSPDSVEQDLMFTLIQHVLFG